jgi:hypothetical protein
MESTNEHKVTRRERALAQRKAMSKHGKPGLQAVKPEAKERLDMCTLIDAAVATPHNFHEVVWATVNTVSHYEAALSRMREAYALLVDERNADLKPLAIQWMDEALKGIGY